MAEGTHKAAEESSGGPLATNILRGRGWRGSIPARRQTLRGNYLDGNRRRYVNLGGDEIAREHSIVNQDFKCSE
jgi:hypothetical protein